MKIPKDLPTDPKEAYRRGYIDGLNEADRLKAAVRSLIASKPKRKPPGDGRKGPKRSGSTPPPFGKGSVGGKGGGTGGAGRG
jgi:hypothetical protein